MPMPHRTFAEVAKRRLVGKEGSERVAVIRALLGELPGYRNGPYADLRKWLDGELERTRVRAKVVHRDSLQVRREGAAQIALVGPPNAGKSSLLQALSDIQIKTGDYAFTTLRPVPALTRIGGVLVQLVEIPGLLEGAREDRGGGRALLGVLRNADAIVYCWAVTEPPENLDLVVREVAAAGIEKRAILALTKADELADGELDRAVGNARLGPTRWLGVVPVSVLDDESLDRLREAIWSLTGLIRVSPRRDGAVDGEPFALPAGATVAEVADRIHHDVGGSCTGARVWGSSARFEGQRVGRSHVLSDGDVVEVLTR
ncbi:MAG TPA: GTPase [Gaiella sp.]|jgi:small GTP-binding protein